ncbi:MAG: M56 family metallopeptidase [Bacillota bacterium]|nr:M56 family metallopeptidase [Bacillota bacterium]
MKKLMNSSTSWIKAETKGSDIVKVTNDIFNWIISSSAAACLLIAVIFTVKIIFKNKMSASWHYYIWFLLLVRLIIPYSPQSPFSILNIVTPHMESRAAIDIYTGINNFTEAAVNEREITAQSDPSVLQQKNPSKYVHTGTAGFSLNEIFEVLWISGVLIFAFFILIINIRLNFKIRKCHSLRNEKTIRLLNECSFTLKIRSNIPVILTSMVNSPSLSGFIKPKLLLPYDILEKSSTTDLKYIIMHELAHLKRKDTAVNWLIIFIKILYWFNPVIWYGFYKMHQDCEVACDAMVLSRIKPEEHNIYGYTIINLLRNMSGRQWIPGVSGIISSKSLMKRRITMISLFKKGSFKWSAIGIVIILVLSITLLTGAKTDPEGNTPNDAAKTGQTVNSNTGAGESIQGISVKEVEGKTFKGKMLTIPDPKKIAVGFNNNINKTTSETAKANNAICAINAGGFTSSGAGGKDYKPTGIIIHEGKVIYSDTQSENSKQDIVGFTDNGVLISGRYTLSEIAKLNVKEAVSFGPRLIVNGKGTVAKGDGGWGLGPRTAIGQKADGTVLLLVIDGRTVNSIGASLLDIQDILLSNGAVNAVNLDGGSSSTMYYDNKVINNPCDSNGERAVPSVFMVMP